MRLKSTTELGKYDTNVIVVELIRALIQLSRDVEQIGEFYAALSDYKISYTEYVARFGHLHDNTYHYLRVLLMLIVILMQQTRAPRSNGRSNSAPQNVSLTVQRACR